ncbi:MAG: hypothetical protein IJC85_04290 [Oscillospiraceae bacterium]|nr:hypothetical protein [Oscillospiraceae bacterium]
MSKKFRSSIALVLAVVMAVTVAMTMSVTGVSAATDPLSATRYRYPLIRFENPNYVSGVTVDENQTTSAYIFTDTPKSNSFNDGSLFASSVEEYGMFNMKLGKNKALRVMMPVANVDASSSYNSHKITLGETVGTSPAVMPETFKGIPTNSKDHGIMLHLEITSLDGTTSNHRRKSTVDGAGVEEIPGEYVNHIRPDLGITFQEGDLKADGSGWRKKAGEVQSSAFEMKQGATITLIWTKDVTFTEADTISAVKRNADGSGVKDENGDYVYENIIPESHKAGDVQEYKCYPKNLDGTDNISGDQLLPYGFCGYIIIPFSEMALAWDSLDADGNLTFRDVKYLYLTQGITWMDEAIWWFDEVCLYGPSFANCNNAYDYGNITFANHKDSLVNRKLITVKEEEVSSEPVSVPNSDEIKTAVTLKNADGSIVLDAPDTAGLKADTKFTAEAPEATDFLTAQLTKFFGSDASKYAAYSVYLGEEGDIEPSDYCKLTFTIPSGLDASKVAVYKLDGESKVEMPGAEVKDGKITIAVKELGTFVLAEKTAEGGSTSTEDGSTSTEDGSTSTEDGSTSTEDGSTTTETSTGTTDDDDKDDDKTSTGTTDNDNEKGSSAWIWIVVAVVVVAAVAVALLVLKKKPAEEAEEAEEETETSDAE